MPLSLYNSLTRRKDVFEPLVAGQVRTYTCGPTVYQRPHVGNYRTFLFADFLRRVLERRGYAVNQVMNVTDVGHFTADDEDRGEDKLEREARQSGKDPWQISREITAVFESDMKRLRARPPAVRPRATDHIPEMLEMVKGLVASGHAYRAGEGGRNVYFAVDRFPGYGKLSGNRLEALEAGARVEVNPEKKNAADFALWKSDPRHVMKWPSEFGEHGFPGWHIECSAMARRYLGDTLDIHTGGEDLLFPHHECEIAQSEATTGKPFARFWLHTKFLSVEGGKMSKSLGNVWSLDDVVSWGFQPRHLRFLLQRVPYRAPMSFSRGALEDAKGAIERLEVFAAELRGAVDGPKIDGLEDRIARAKAEFDAGLDDDLNAAAASAAVFELVSHVRAKVAPGSPMKLPRKQADALLAALEDFDSVFDVLHAEELGDDAKREIDALVAERQAARARKDFARADAIRGELTKKGIVVEDVAGGARWRRG
ncbi:MAG TPA: cysteine--tRNA ligase [Planctomycetota bacterium]|nr:cysteine--tRNA ligase [Planctomycetota bacterium]